MKRILVSVLLLAMLAGCGTRKQEPPQPIKPPPVTEMDDTGAPAGSVGAADDTEAAKTEESAAAMTDFGLALFRGCLRNENVLVSPLSVTEAMALAANGAAGQTLSQMESALGMSAEALSESLRQFARSLGSGEGGKTHLANGIWVNGNGAMRLRPEYRQINEDALDAGVFEVPFDDSTEDEINAWVAENTGGRIDRIIEGLSQDGAAVLVNAMAFDGVWEDIYREDQIGSGTFTAEDGQIREAEMMSSSEDVYLQDEHAVGFVKYYQGRDYAFAALLPEEGMTLADYAATLTGEGLLDMLGRDETTPVEVTMPKFSAEYGTDLAGVLEELGITDAFDRERADFFSMAEQAEGNLYVDQVQHRTFIAVDEKGTEAGAATAATFRTTSLMGPTETVTLDRPFLYMLTECGSNVPLFIGAVTDIQ